MSELRIEHPVYSAADTDPKNPLPPLVRIHELNLLEDTTGIPPEMAANMSRGHIRNILPYTFQDGYIRELKSRPFRTAILENDVLRAEFLLEMGGRLWSLIHKSSGRELLKKNPVIQLANLAVRNAWFSGGVEWNAGIKGHSVFTCSPIFAGRIERADGTPILRMYEWERKRGTVFQIDTFLPDGSQVLFVHIRLINPQEHPVPAYWWSNMTVAQTPDIRVITPAEYAYTFSYSKNRLDHIPLPETSGRDMTRPYTARHASDCFYDVPKMDQPWICALDQDGTGLIQTSTSRLNGRKLFVWGTNPGGQKWQGFLSKAGQAYTEIQAGLATTQVEYLEMPPQSEWTWLETYGLLQTDPSAVHGAAWKDAQNSVAGSLKTLIPISALKAEYQTAQQNAQNPLKELIQQGSGWGALEQIRREKQGKTAFCTTEMIFPPDSIGPEQHPWKQLLVTGVFPDTETPAGFMVQPEWHQLLEASVSQGSDMNWSAWNHLGIMRFNAGDLDGAQTAWKHSLKKKETFSVLRNLAVLAVSKNQPQEACTLIKKALHLHPGLRPLAIECGQMLIEHDRAQDWLDLVPILPDALRSDGRIQLLSARAALDSGDLDTASAILKQQPVIADLREGETTLSDLWIELHAKQISIAENIPIDNNLRNRALEEFPIPQEMDFRMNIYKEKPRQ